VATAAVCYNLHKVVSELSLYIHVPFCRRKCGYCSFVTYAGRDKEIPVYIEALCREICLTQRPGALVNTIYFGGGTPSLLAAADISRILGTVRDCYPLGPDIEITLEVNPGTVDAAYFESVRTAGINRLSLGVQSLSDTELGFLGRSHTVADSLQAIIDARSAGFENLSLDFIYGLPGRSLFDWEMMLNEIVNLDADHLSLYGLTLEADTPLGTAVAKGQLPAPDADQAASEYELSSTVLEDAGYRYYEISNWARPGYESRHNAVYWQRGEYLGLGAAAHSFFDGQRIANTSNLDDYMGPVASGSVPPREIEKIDGPTALAEAIILGLRLTEGVSLDDIGRHFSIDLHRRYAAEIGELSGLGLVKMSGGRLCLTPRGRLLGNEVFVRFLPS
jgi:oxygen-independent coproporphyrinogen III oxidase